MYLCIIFKCVLRRLFKVPNVFNRVPMKTLYTIIYFIVTFLYERVNLLSLCWNNAVRVGNAYLMASLHYGPGTAGLHEYIEAGSPNKQNVQNLDLLIGRTQGGRS